MRAGDHHHRHGAFDGESKVKWLLLGELSLDMGTAPLMP